MQENTPPLHHHIGQYLIQRTLGTGGMGEVFLAYDPICKRQIALKQIRKELSHNPSLQKRFLREALVAAQLSHPSIIPIYSIHRETNDVFYTMPYVQGETLKQILKTSLDEEKEGEIQHPIGASIPSLASIFLKVCQAIAYAHSKGILHRDLKPENIIIGTYGEVLLFDWGLAELIGEPAQEEEIDDTSFSINLTKPGKVPGTLHYLSPERILGHPSTTQTDIYALGVMLYQMLTLHAPFYRKSAQHSKRTVHLERLIDPVERAPYRDIPDHLADIAKRCLNFKAEDRFQSVDEMIAEVNSYLEGRPEWIPSAQLDIHHKNDWEFQENIVLAKHMAITRSPDLLEWVSLMLSKHSFTGNIKLDTQIKVNDKGLGIGIVLAVPEASLRKGLIDEGYFLWIGSEKEPGLRLFQWDVEVMSIPDLCLKPEQWHQLSIELINNHVYFYFDQVLRCHYISHVPMIGTHLGILYRDADFALEPLKVSVGSQNAMINCIAIPDTFLANKNYTKALSEYRRIASSFAGRTEGREALFRAGITLLQQGTSSKHKQERENLYNLALDEFSKLRFTLGAPLELLGKSLVYKATRETEEELKCLELALRKYPKHPLKKLIVEHITFRIHEASNRDRIAAFHFLLLALRHLPHMFTLQDNARLLESLKRHLEPLPFFLPDSSDHQLHLHLAFLLNKPMTILEILEKATSPTLINNAFLALYMLGQHQEVERYAHLCSELKPLQQLLSQQIHAPTTPFALHCAYSLIESQLMQGDASLKLLSQLGEQEDLHYHVLTLWTLLLNKQWTKAQAILEQYPAETLTNEYSPLYPLMGCWLRQTEGEEIALSHFSAVMDIPHPPTTMLLSFYLRGKIHEKKGWGQSAFPWEKIQLFRQLHLFYHCADEPLQAKYYFNQLKRELKRVYSPS